MCDLFLKQKTRSLNSETPDWELVDTEVYQQENSAFKSSTNFNTHNISFGIKILRN